MISPTEYLQLFQAALSEAGNPEVAEGQMKYMRNQFDFYGCKAPVWVGVTKQLFEEQGYFDAIDLTEFARLCNRESQRELHYIALQMIEKRIKKQAEDFIEVLEELILTNSWWDTVDWIAKLVGIHFQRYPFLIQPTTRRWMDSGEMWLQRVCLIFQLRYKDQTDQGLLFNYILELATSKEFFIQKAAGWALRQYSRTKPQAVADFIDSHDLAALTKREGGRLIKQMNK